MSLNKRRSVIYILIISLILSCIFLLFNNQTNLKVQTENTHFQTLTDELSKIKNQVFILNQNLNQNNQNNIKGRRHLINEFNTRQLALEQQQSDLAYLVAKTPVQTQNLENQRDLSALIPSYTQSNLVPTEILGSFRGSDNASANAANSSRKTDPTLIIGIPTVYRTSGQTGTIYLIDTIQQLFEKIAESDYEKILISVFVSEPHPEYIQIIKQDLIHNFEKFLNAEVLEIIIPNQAAYPDHKHIISETDRLDFTTFNDEKDRQIWRTKQNLDYIYMWSSVLNINFKYFLQLEDDLKILQTDLYNKILKQIDFFNRRITSTYQKNIDSWYMIDFINVGFIGKMFTRFHLNNLMFYTSLGYKIKPCDWLCFEYVQSSVCSPEMDQKTCNTEMSKVKYVVPGSKNSKLFEHIGKYSTLEGQIRKVKP